MIRKVLEVYCDRCGVMISSKSYNVATKFDNIVQPVRKIYCKDCHEKILAEQARKGFFSRLFH